MHTVREIRICSGTGCPRDIAIRMLMIEGLRRGEEGPPVLPLMLPPPTLPHPVLTMPTVQDRIRTELPGACRDTFVA